MRGKLVGFFVFFCVCILLIGLEMFVVVQGVVGEVTMLDMDSGRCHMSGTTVHSRTCTLHKPNARS